jgi:lipopolysaccharide transport system ATP-binding protein
MSNTVIKVENLSKSYILKHQNTTPYTTFREEITNKAKSIFNSSGTFNNKSTEEFWALNDVSFEINQGDRVGIIGRNGAGKSTLLKVLSRIVTPTKGRITIEGRVASLLEVGTGFHPELSGRENIFLNGAILGMSMAEIKSKFDEIVAFSEVEKFLDTPVKRYSSGMYVRLAFAVAAHLEPEILIVDEVLAVGDSAFQKKCLGKMKDVSSEGRTVLFVSHAISSVSMLCNKGVLLNKGQVVLQDDIKEVIKVYEGDILALNGNGGDFSSLYSGEVTDENEFTLLKIQFLSKGREPLKQVKTADDFTIYAEFYSPRDVENGSINFFIKTLSGVIILRMGTMPDQNVSYKFKKGINKIYCNIKSLPLPYGTYVFSAALAIPMREWLLKLDELFTFDIKENDIFNSGYPPLLDNSLAVVNYDWEILS